MTNSKMIRRIAARGALLAGLVMAVGACQEGLTEANMDPNAPTDVGPALLLPEAIRVPVEMAFGAGQMLSHTFIWPQHGAQIQYPDEEVGDVRPERMQIYWDTYYSDAAQDIQLVIDKGVESGDAGIEGVGRVWKSWIFHLVTDLWGDVPYTEALQGDDGTITPAYDMQQDIYAALLQELEVGAGMLAGGGTAGFGDGDILYGDDAEAWRRFANSVRMRLAMRMSEVDATTAEAEFVAAYNAGGFQSNADNAMLEWPGAPYENVIYENYTGRDDHGISATMVDTLLSLSDPRLELYAEPAAVDGLYRGLGNGLSDPPLPLPNYSRIGDFWRADGAATPTAIMTYSEVLFLQAEAAERGWIAGDPAALYEAAIRANMNQYDTWSPANAPTDAEIDAYLAQPEVAYSGLESIHLQKWISLYMNGAEAFAEWRRTDVPMLAMGPDVNTSRIPVRFTYPVGEQNLNNSNLQAAMSRQGPNELVTTVWWDVD